MKIIEAMKKIKANKQKIIELQKLIGDHCANLSIETAPYGDKTPDKIIEWTQACHDTALENIRLLTAIQRTNLQTRVAIKIGDNDISKTIAEWVWRKREYAKLDLFTWSKIGDRGLKEMRYNQSVGEPLDVKIIRHYKPELRDKKLEEFRSEGSLIDAALEVVNAVTDLVE